MAFNLKLCQVSVIGITLRSWQVDQIIKRKWKTWNREMAPLENEEALNYGMMKTSMTAKACNNVVLKKIVALRII